MWSTDKIDYKPLQQPLLLTRSSLLYADGHFICLSEHGILCLFKVNPKKFELIAATVDQGSVQVTNDVSMGLENTDISFICVGTPSLNNGDQNQNAVLRLTEQLGEALKRKTKRHILVYRSTLVPGTVEKTLIPVLESFPENISNFKFEQDKVEYLIFK